MRGGRARIANAAVAVLTFALLLAGSAEDAAGQVQATAQIRARITACPPTRPACRARTSDLLERGSIALDALVTDHDDVDAQPHAAVPLLMRIEHAPDIDTTRDLSIRSAPPATAPPDNTLPADAAAWASAVRAVAARAGDGRTRLVTITIEY